MQQPEHAPAGNPGLRARRVSLLRIFSLRRDQDRPEEIDEDIRAGVEIVGTNLWVLIFAILVASVGLNVNSTAVIIGAMLISPLMGPIVGAGYALALQDKALLHQCVRSLLVFTAISLLASTAYFAISPLKEPGSELMARTSPTLWDVLIAFFGGAAGIIALTRRSISNVVPGVAIATALMPPLCTAGYALANGRWDWFGGALYLYSINSVFIAYATLVFVKLMRLRPPSAGETENRKLFWLTSLMLLAMIVPSAYLGWKLVHTQSFTSSVQRIVARVAEQNHMLVARSMLDADARRADLMVAGAMPPEQFSAQLQQALEGAGLGDVALAVQSVNNRALDEAGLRKAVSEDVRRVANAQSEAIRAELSSLRSAVQQRQTSAQELVQIGHEIQVQYPQLQQVLMGLAVAAPAPAPLASAASAPAATASAPPPASDMALPPAAQVLVQLQAPRPLSSAELQRLRQWLAVRLPGRTVHLAYVLPATYATGAPAAGVAPAPRAQTTLSR